MAKPHCLLPFVVAVLIEEKKMSYYHSYHCVYGIMMDSPGVRKFFDLIFIFGPSRSVQSWYQTKIKKIYEKTSLLDPRLREGPMSSLPSIRLSIRLSVRQSVVTSVRLYVRPFRFFSKLSHRNYLIFSMKLGVDSNLKLTEPDFSSKKSGFPEILKKVPNFGQKSGFSTFPQNLVHRCIFFFA